MGAYVFVDGNLNGRIKESRDSAATFLEVPPDLRGTISSDQVPEKDKR